MPAGGNAHVCIGETEGAIGPKYRSTPAGTDPGDRSGPIARATLRVAIFHASLPETGRKPGGVEVTVHRLANALLQSGECTVTVFSCSPPAEGSLYAHRRLSSGMAAGGKFFRMVYLPFLLNFVDFAGFDVLHLHGDDWFFIRRGLPTVRTFHGSAKLEARYAQNWRRKLLQYAVYPLEQLSARLATSAVAVGTEAAAIYHASDLADNGVDTAIFHPRAKAPEPLLFYVGTWHGRKRGALAYRIFLEQVLPCYPTATLFMACDMVPDHPRVVNGGFPDQTVLADWMGRAWVFLYPSLYEGFGIPYIEALASGTAIVTSGNSGADYVLQDGEYGQVCADDQLGPEVLKLLKDAGLRTKLQQHGQRRAAAFAWPGVARQHRKIYEDAIRVYHE